MSRDEADAKRTDLVGIYLRDHLAAATLGVELAKRFTSSNREEPFAQDAARLAADIEGDRDALLELARRAGVGPSFIKERAAWVAEKMGRFKLNGSLTGYSDLSRVEEIEALCAGVHAKKLLWKTAAMLQVSSNDEIARLTARAEEQLDRLESLREQALTRAFGEPPASA